MWGGSVWGAGEKAVASAPMGCGEGFVGRDDPGAPLRGREKDYLSTFQSRAAAEGRSRDNT